MEPTQESTQTIAACSHHLIPNTYTVKSSEIWVTKMLGIQKGLLVWFRILSFNHVKAIKVMYNELVEEFSGICLPQQVEELR